MNDEAIKTKTTLPDALESNDDSKSNTPRGAQFVVFELDSEQYAVPIEDVREVIKIPDITPVPNSPDYISGLLNLRGKILPALNLEIRFGLIRQHKDIQINNIIIVEAGIDSFGVMVDTIVEVLRVPADSIQEAPSVVKGKIGIQNIKGVIVLNQENKNQDNSQVENNSTSNSLPHYEKQRIILLLNLKQLLTNEEKKEVENTTKNTISSPEKSQTTENTTKNLTNQPQALPRVAN